MLTGFHPGVCGARCQVVGGWDVLGLDPDVPVVQVCPQHGAAVERALGFGEDVPRYGVLGRFRCWTGCVRRIRVMVHAVRSGARVPSGEDRGQIRIVLPDTVQPGASEYVVKGCIQVQSNKNAGLVRFRKVLDGFDHLVGSILGPRRVEVGQPQP